MSEKIVRFFDNDRFAVQSGVKLLSAENGEAVAELRPEGRHLNAAGGVQGGAIFTLCDLVCAAAANSGGELTVSAGADIKFIRAVKGKVLTAKGHVISRGRRLCFCSSEVLDEDGTIVAEFSETCCVLGSKIDFDCEI
jgi:acyl-CoA thioesterase